MVLKSKGRIFHFKAGGSLNLLLCIFKTLSYVFQCKKKKNWRDIYYKGMRPVRGMEGSEKDVGEKGQSLFFVYCQ